MSQFCNINHLWSSLEIKLKCSACIYTVYKLFMLAVVSVYTARLCIIIHNTFYQNRSPCLWLSNLSYLSMFAYIKTKLVEKKKTRRFNPPFKSDLLWHNPDLKKDKKVEWKQGKREKGKGKEFESQSGHFPFPSWLLKAHIYKPRNRPVLILDSVKHFSWIRLLPDPQTERNQIRGPVTAWQKLIVRHRTASVKKHISSFKSHLKYLNSVMIIVDTLSHLTLFHWFLLRRYRHSILLVELVFGSFLFDGNWHVK